MNILSTHNPEDVHTARRITVDACFTLRVASLHRIVEKTRHPGAVVEKPALCEAFPDLKLNLPDLPSQK